jgi:gliding motility-associated-like protein
MTLLRFIAALMFALTVPFNLSAQLTEITDELVTGETASYCPNAADSLTIDILTSSFDADVDFFVAPPGDCINYTALRPGRDTALLKVCSINGCDTVRLIVTVAVSGLPPVLQNDVGQVNSGLRLIVNLLANDQIFAPITEYGLLEEGQSIEANMQSDYSLSYFAPLESCGFSDALRYYVCTANGCDTAVVTVTVTCPNVIIYNAISPNGDGLNEVFYIEGIASFPESELSIFNAQGTEVYRSTSYRNDWSGTTPDGRLLPSGTYYYRLRLNSEIGQQGEMKGVVEIQR